MRHVRPHVGYLSQLLTYFAGAPVTSIASVYAQLCHIVDLAEPGIIYTIGLIWHTTLKVFRTMPEDVLTVPPQVWIYRKG